MRVKRTQGFTLVEVLVVITLIAIVSVFALPKISSYFKISLNSATREIASIVREAYNAAVMTGRVHRMVFDLTNQQYWVESGPPTALLDTEETLEKEKERARFSRKDEKAEQSKFSLETSVTRKKQSLPQGVSFMDVFTEQSEDAITEGTAYAHIFPHGLTEQTLIHLKDLSDNKISLAITPLVGRTRLLLGYMTEEEAFGAKK